MARLAAEGEPWLEVSALELSRPGKSYTSDTLRALSGKYPGDTLYLLMGTDMFLSLHTWHEPEVICSLAVIVGMHREEDKDGAMEQQKGLLEERFGANAVVLHNVPLEISSTHLRRMLIDVYKRQALPASDRSARWCRRSPAAPLYLHPAAPDQ